MPRFLLSAMPFTGHVTPLLAVASELVARGHDVRFYTGSAFRQRVEASGASLVPWRTAPDFDEYDIQKTFPRLEGRKGFAQLLINVVEVFVKTAPAQLEDLRAEWQREPWDAIAGDEMSIGTAFFAEATACPWGTVAVLPLNLIGPGGPPSGMGLVPGTHAVTRARDAALRRLVRVVSRPITKPLAEARSAAGLPASRRTLDQIVFSSRFTVASGSPLLDFGRTDRPGWVHFVGELRGEASGPPELPDWWSDLDGRTVVHVTQGTANIDPSDLIRPALDALADRDVLAVVATGERGRDRLPFAVPANGRVAGFLPYPQLLPRVSAVITNGGWGGTLAALSHGIPLVIAGGDLDKPEIAARVAWTGAGVNLKTGTPTVAQVRAGYERVAADTSMTDAAARVGAQLRSLGGAPRAADLLETLLITAKG